MLNKLFGSSKKRRSDQVVKLLTEIALAPIATPSFERQNAFVRAYSVALGIITPQYAAAVAFPDKVYPPWDDTVWRKSDEIFEDLASILAWRQCLAAFSDLEILFEPDGIEAARQSLMGICGSVFPASDRAEHFMRRYATFESSVEARHEFFEQGFVLSEEYLESMQHLEIHAWMINEALGEPPLSHTNGDPMFVFGLQMYLAELELDCIVSFKNRGLDLFNKHIAAGRP